MQQSTIQMVVEMLNFDLCCEAISPGVVDGCVCNEIQQGKYKFIMNCFMPQAGMQIFCVQDSKGTIWFVEMFLSIKRIDITAVNLNVLVSVMVWSSWSVPLVVQTVLLLSHINERTKFPEQLHIQGCLFSQTYWANTSCELDLGFVHWFFTRIQE